MIFRAVAPSQTSAEAQTGSLERSSASRLPSSADAGSVDHFETANMMTVGKVVHKDSQHGPLHCRKAAAAGGLLGYFVPRFTRNVRCRCQLLLDQQGRAGQPSAEAPRAMPETTAATMPAAIKFG